MKSVAIKQNRQIPQQMFEYWIEILIMYKRSNPEIDVYLSEKYIQKAIKWFQKSPEIQKMMQNENLMNMLKNKVTNETDLEKISQEIENQ